MKLRFKIFMILALVASLLISNGLYMVTRAQSIQEAQAEKQKIESSLSEAKNLVNSLKNDKESAEKNIKDLDGKMLALEAEAKDTESEIESINSNIEKLNNDIIKQKQLIEQKKSEMESRIVYSYENGKYKILNMIFSAGSLSEIFSILDNAKALADFDNKMIEEYSAQVETLNEKISELENQESEARDLAQKAKSDVAALDVLKNAKQEQLLILDGQLTDAKEIQAVYEKELIAQNEVLNQIQAAIAAEKARLEEERKRAEEEHRRKEEEEKRRQQELAAQQQANQQPTTEIEKPKEEEKQETTKPESSQTASGFIWPCPSSHLITSDFGMRESPTAGASTNHKGIDIGASRGSSILAAQGGTVLVSEFSSSAGNYIIISHGLNSSGAMICSVYMHADTLLVSKGETVSQGQEIAKVGSTGYSTGPHLHFAVTENGTYVSPWKYVS